MKLDPSQSGASISLGNISLSRHATEDAIADYSNAANNVRDPQMKATLQRQVDLLKRGAWDGLKPIRVPERE